MNATQISIFIRENYMKNFMLHSSFLISIIISILMTSFSVLGQWYETQGSARVDSDTVEIARTKAMESALKKALLVAGASVSSIQQVVNGLITQDEISIRASGSVNSIELIDEIYTGNLITVTIRADIFPQEKKCFAVNFKKSLLLTRSHILHREQANIGNIYDLNKAVITNLNNKLKQQSSFTKTNLLLKSKTQFSRLNNSLYSEKIKDLVMSLSDSTNSQYILFSEINDLSFEQSSTNTWQFWQQSTYPRNFTFTLYLYNGVNGEMTWQKEYSNKAVWQFSKRQSVNVHNIAYWQSEYGLMINKLLNKVVADIDENIMCEPSRGKIVQINGNQITINLGRQNGVKIGDEFSLLHLNNFKGNNGLSYAGFNVSPFKVKITKLTEQSATAITINNELLGNIQINDLAVRY